MVIQENKKIFNILIEFQREGNLVEFEKAVINLAHLNYMDSRSNGNIKESNNSTEKNVLSTNISSPIDSNLLEIKRRHKKTRNVETFLKTSEERIKGGRKQGNKITKTPPTENNSSLFGKSMKVCDLGRSPEFQGFKLKDRIAGKYS